LDGVPNSGDWSKNLLVKDNREKCKISAINILAVKLRHFLSTRKLSVRHIKD